MKKSALALAALLLFAPVPVVSAQNITLRYGQIPSTIKTVSALHFYIAQRKGFFSREGITLEMLPIEGGAANMVIALSKGVVDITRTATPYLVQDVLKGSDNVAILGETATPIYSLIAKPEIKTFADLKGKVVGLSLAIDTISISTRKLLALNGVQEGDFKVKELVGTPARADCLRKNECDAVPLGQPEDFCVVERRVPSPRRVHRCHGQFSIHRERGKAFVGHAKQRRFGALCSCPRRIVSLHARAGQS